MKIMTILGTRPEIIRLSLVIEKLDRFASKHILVHTGQNYDERLSAIFFKSLGVRQPDEAMGVQGSSFGEQIGQILERAEKLLLKHRPDRLLILGDTNSGLTALVARRLGIPVFHMEAGNRCFDDLVPEEINRRVIDHSSTVLMPYTQRSRENLIREGLASDRIFVTGNPIKEVMDRHRDSIERSDVLGSLGLDKGGYSLETLHRYENVDYEQRLRCLVEALASLAEEYRVPVVCSFHPRTRSKVEQFRISIDQQGLRFLEPFDFFDFVAMEKSALCILSDSGTVQEEACILGTPNVTIRDVTERPETLECGSNILSGSDPDMVASSVRVVLGRVGNWQVPNEYLAEDVSDTVVRLLLGYRRPDAAELSWQAGRR